MKRLMITAVVAVFLSASAAAGGNGLTGKEIAEKANEANLSSKGLVTKGEVILKDLSGQSEEKRPFIILAKDTGGKRSMLFRFTGSSYKGTTFLTCEKENGGAVQYIYLNSIGSARQVESSDKENSFVDTDISNEDMGGGNTDDYEYKRIEDKTIRGYECYGIERYPKDKSSRYSRHVLYLDKESLLPVMAKSYTKEGRIAKTIMTDGIEKTSQGVFTAKKMEVTDIDAKHATVVISESAEEKDIPSGYFNKNRMGKAWDF